MPAPPAPSTWYAWIVRPSMAAIVSSSVTDSLIVSVWIITWTSCASATRSAVSITAG